MTEPASLSERRWDKVSDPAAHSLRDMLMVALARLERGELEADHMVVVYSRLSDGQPYTGYLQAGSFDPFAQVGMLHHAIKLFEE